MSKANELPKGWAECRISEIADSMKNGIYKEKSFYSDDGTPCLRMYNIDEGRLIWEDLKRMILTPLEQTEYGLLPDDLVVNRVNSRELVGKACVIPSGLGPAVFESKNIRLRVSVAKVNPSFLCFRLLQTGRHYFSRNAQQTVGMASVNQDQLGAFPFPLAPRREQDRIVAKIEELFSDLDVGVAALKRAKANLKRYRAAVLKAAVEGKLTAEWRAKHPKAEPASKLLERILIERRKKWEAEQLAKFTEAGKEPPKNWKAKYVEPLPPDKKDLPELPEGWCWASVDQLTTDSLIGLDRGRQFQSSEGSGSPYIKMNNVTMNGCIDWNNLVFVPASDQERRRFQLSSGDLLFNTRNSTELVGKVGLVTTVLPNSVFNNNLMRLRVCVDPTYVCRWMCSGMFREKMALVKKATTSVAAVYGKDLFPLPVALPPHEEQHAVVAEVEERLSQITVAEQQIDTSLARASRLRQSILKQAFEGKLVPQDSNDEPASVLLERIKATLPDGRTAAPKQKRTKQKAS